MDDWIGSKGKLKTKSDLAGYRDGTAYDNVDAWHAVESDAG